MKMEKPFNCSQEGDDVENPKTLSNSHEKFSDPNEDIEKRQHGKEDGEARALNYDYEPLSKHSEVDVVGVKSSIEMNSLNESKDDEGSEYSSLKNEAAPGNLRLRCKVKNESVDGKLNTLEQPKTESSCSNSTNFVLSASSNDSYQESALDARTFKGSNTNNANTSSMSSSTCTDLGYHQKEVRVSNMESGIIEQSKHSKEKPSDAPEINPYRKEFFADMNMKVVSGMNEGCLDVGEREESTLLGFDLNEDMAYSNEVEQQTAASCVNSVRKPIAVFAKCEGPVGESSSELGFKGLGKGGWKGSASTTSAFRPTCHFKGSKGSGQKLFEGFDLNVDASGMENEKEFPIQNDASEGASSVREKFSIDLNVASENDENFQSSRTVRDFNLNDDLTASDPDVQEGIIPSIRQGAIHDYETFSLRNAGVPEPRYIGPMFLPRMTSMPFMVRVPEQAEHATRAFPFHTPAYIEPRNPVFSLASSLDVPLYPAHLNGIPAFHGGPNLVEFRGGPGPHNVLKVGAPYNLYDGVNPPENATSGGPGMQVLSAPMHPMFAQQLNDFRHGGLLSLTPMKRKEPEVRWNPR